MSHQHSNTSSKTGTRHKAEAQTRLGDFALFPVVPDPHFMMSIIHRKRRDSRSVELSNHPTGSIEVRAFRVPPFDRLFEFPPFTM
jgi:hypothetical protein